MQSRIQIMLNDKRPKSGLAVCAAVDGDLKKLADMFVESETGEWPGSTEAVAHYHLRRRVALFLLKAVLPSEIQVQAMHLVETMMEATDDVAGLTHNFELEGTTYESADCFEKAYADAIRQICKERDREDDDRPAHPDRAAFGRGAL